MTLGGVLLTLVCSYALSCCASAQITQFQSRGVDEEEHDVMLDRTHARTAARAYQSIVQLRGMWVKTGQYLSSRADIMPEVRE